MQQAVSSTLPTASPGEGGSLGRNVSALDDRKDIDDESKEEDDELDNDEEELEGDEEREEVEDDQEQAAEEEEEEKDEEEDEVEDEGDQQEGDEPIRPSLLLAKGKNGGYEIMGTCTVSCGTVMGSLLIPVDEKRPLMIECSCMGKCPHFPPRLLCSIAQVTNLVTPFPVLLECFTSEPSKLK
jgi:hypothetical protein